MLAINVVCLLLGFVLRILLLCAPPPQSAIMAYSSFWDSILASRLATGLSCASSATNSTRARALASMFSSRSFSCCNWKGNIRREYKTTKRKQRTGHRTSRLFSSFSSFSPYQGVGWAVNSGLVRKARENSVGMQREHAPGREPR